MILPKINVPSTLQSQINQVTEPHYNKIPLSAISIGLILLAINENIIDEAEFIDAKKSKKKLGTLANHCAKSLTSYVRKLFNDDNYNCMTLSFQHLKDNYALIGDQDALIGFRLQLDSLLTYNLALTKDIPYPLVVLAQKISLLMGSKLSCINSFDCTETCYESEQWEHLKDSASKLNLAPDFTLYQTLFPDDAMFEEEINFLHFMKSMTWYDQADEVGGIRHNDAITVDAYLDTLSTEVKAHPVYEKLIAVHSLLKDTIIAKDKFELSNEQGYEEETSPIFHGLLAFGGFDDEENSLTQHVQDINNVGESMVSVFTPISFNALKHTVVYLDKLCSLSKLCDESLENFVTPICL
jgi:hypothetical protein|tara:strand:+ start:66346 stop:67407 length:1062 start_codon:yes stop_codon:yes gene_type:complete